MQTLLALSPFPTHDLDPACSNDSAAFLYRFVSDNIPCTTASSSTWLSSGNTATKAMGRDFSSQNSFILGRTRQVASSQRRHVCVYYFLCTASSFNYWWFLFSSTCKTKLKMKTWLPDGHISTTSDVVNMLAAGHVISSFEIILPPGDTDIAFGR